MILKVALADQLLDLNVPDQLIDQAHDFFAKMDSDMDAGWQVNRDWVDQPNAYLRGQIAADKLLTALENEDHNLGRLMAGYILARFPGIELLELSEQGETRDHVLRLAEGTEAAANSQQDSSFVHTGLPDNLNRMQALAQAGKDVSSVFKMGKQYRFSVYNHSTEKWDESPAFADKEAAEQLRDQVFKQRFEALAKSH